MGAAASISGSSRLSEDYVLSSELLLDASAGDGALAVIPEAPDGSAPASVLAIVAGLGLAHVTRCSESQSGWRLEQLAGGGAAVEVAAATDSNGATLAVFQDGTHTFLTTYEQSSWSKPQTLALATELRIEVPLLGSAVAYGVTPDGNLLLVRDGVATTCDLQGTLLGGQAVLRITDDADSWELAAAVNGVLKLYTGSASQRNSGPETVTTPARVARVHLTYAHLNSTMLLFSAPDATLYTSLGFTDQFAVIPIAKVVRGAGIPTANGHMSFFGVDGSGLLSVLHQTGWDPSTSAPVWAPVLPLEPGVAAVAVPVSTRSNATALFATGLDTSLRSLAKDGPSSPWCVEPVLAHDGPQIYEQSRYRTQLTVTDENGNPAPNVDVTLSASAPVMILADGATALLGPEAGQTATLTSDGTGVVTLTTPALALCTPEYTVLALGSTARKVRPDSYLHEFLAGSTPISTGAVSIPPMSATTLQGATVEGAPLFPNLSDELALAAASAINAVVSTTPSLLGAPAGSSPGVAQPAGWMLDLRVPAFTLLSRESLTGSLTGSLADASGAGFDIWDIASFAEDVWHAIKTGALEVVHWVVDTEHKIVKLAVRIGEDIKELVGLTLSGIEDALAAVHGILDAIGASVEKVLRWLRDLFSWHDIWNTKLVFEHLVRAAIPALQHLVEQAKADADAWLDGLRGKVNDQLEAVAQTLGGRTLAELSSGGDALLAPTGSKARGAPSPLPAVEAVNSNWLLSKVLDELPGSGALDDVHADLPSNIAEDVLAPLRDSRVLADLETAFEQLEDFASLAFGEPRSIGTQGAADLVRAAEALADFSIDTIKTLLDVAFALFDAGLGVLDDVLTTPLREIPLVSSLYKQTIGNGESPTLVGLSALLAAIPATLGYKLAEGGTAPFDDATTQAILATSYTPTLAGEAEAGQAQGGVPLPAAAPMITTYLSGLQACLDMLIDGIADGPATPLVKAAGWFDIALNSVMQMLTWPNRRLFDFSWASAGAGERLMGGAWSTAWAPLLLNGVLLLLPGTIAEENDPAGKAALTIIGGFTLYLGVAGSAFGLHEDPPTANGWNVAAAVLGPFGNMWQFLRFESMEKATDGVSFAVKLLLDDIGDVGAGFTQWGGI